MTKMSLLALAAVVSSAFAISCRTEKPSNVPANTSTANRATATPDQFAQTRAVFTKNCQNCHGANGEGGPVKLEDGTKLKVPSLREGHALHHPDSDFVKQINKGGDGMPAFADKLKPTEVDDLVKFIRREFQGGATATAK